MEIPSPDGVQIEHGIEVGDDTIQLGHVVS